MSLASTLWHLQVIDQELDDNANRARQADEGLVGNPALTAARAALNEVQKQLAEFRGALRSEELEAKSLDVKIKELEERLYSGRVTNPKELGGLEKDLQMHKRHRSEQDDQLLRLMESVEQMQARLEEESRALDQVESARSSEVQRLSGEKEMLTARLTELDAERERTRAALGDQALRSYDQLRRSKSGRAVAQLRRDACGTCGVTTPSGLIQRIHAGDEIILCPGCGRILAP